MEPGTVVLPGDFFGAFVSGGTVVGFVPGTVVGVAVAVAAVPPTETQSFRNLCEQRVGP